jgi:hypothetical protein
VVGLTAPHRLIWRSITQGSPGCHLPPFQPERPGHRSEVWTRSCGVGKAHRANATMPPCPFVDDFGWHIFPSLNQAAREELTPLGVAFLDVQSMSEQWPGAHTAFRHGGGRDPPDCLHFTLPGVPDTWNAMLVGALQHCSWQEEMTYVS